MQSPVAVVTVVTIPTPVFLVRTTMTTSASESKVIALKGGRAVSEAALDLLWGLEGAGRVRAWLPGHRR